VKGFTLLELLVVLLIATSVVTLAMPQLGSLRAGLALRSEARQLASALRLCRSEAIVRQGEASLILDLAQRTYRHDGSARVHRLARDTELTLLAAHSGREPPRSGAIRFYADGSSSGARVVLAATNARYVIDVDWLTGRVAIQ
jgi:general secretion pathway protein H